MNITEVIKRPLITEKSHRLVKEKNEYTLVVDSEANKSLIKKTVEELFSVKVLAIRVLNRPQKMRKKTKIAGYKKAIVILKEGDKIPLFEVEGEKK